MILIEEIKEACKTPKIEDCKGHFSLSNLDPEKTYTLHGIIELAFSELGVRRGEKNISKEFIGTTVEFICQDLEKSFKYMHVGEAALAIRTYDGDQFEKYGANMAKAAIEKYLFSDVRQKYKNMVAKEENKDALLLPEKTGWTEEERIEKMRERYRENMQRVRDNYPVKDIGGLLFDHMSKLGLVEMCQEDIDETLMDLVEKRKANPFDTYVRELLRKHSAGEKVIVPYVQERVLRKYFIMEIEARKIKQNKHETDRHKNKDG